MNSRGTVRFNHSLLREFGCRVHASSISTTAVAVHPWQAASGIRPACAAVCALHTPPSTEAVYTMRIESE